MTCSSESHRRLTVRCLLSLMRIAQIASETSIMNAGNKTPQSKGSFPTAYPEPRTYSAIDTAQEHVDRLKFGHPASMAFFGHLSSRRNHCAVLQTMRSSISTFEQTLKIECQHQISRQLHPPKCNYENAQYFSNPNKRPKRALRVTVSHWPQIHL